MNEETADFSFLLSGSTLVLALLAFYVGRALWIARREWSDCAADTKFLYLMVAPVLTLAVDLLELTDRLFWKRGERSEPKPVRARKQSGLAVSGMRAKTAMRSSG